MCNPALAFAAVSLIVSAAGTVMANNNQNKLMEAQGEAANKAANKDYQSLIEQANQTNDAAAQEKLQRQLQTARERGRIMVAQGDAGVGGKSSLALLNNTIMQERMDLGVMDANNRDAISQINTTMQGIETGNAGRVDEAKAGSVSPGSSMLSATMNGASAAASGYSMGKSLSKIGPSSSPTGPGRMIGKNNAWKM